MSRLATTTRTLRGWLDPLVDFCFPKQCPACRMPFDSNQLLCDTCGPELQQLLASPACHQCAMPAAFDDACPHCLGKGVHPFDRIASLGLLKKPMQQMVHAIKYRRQWPLARDLADLALQRPAVRTLLTDAEVIVPVPLFAAKQVERGYNQAEVIAREVARHFHLPVANVAERIKATASQAQLRPRRDRFENLRGSFLLTRPEAIAGKHVVVVDDVMTTGATLGVFGRTLLSANPASLSAFVIAVADPKGRQFEVI